ncbi:MAG: [Fe-Fe] hydrogenase large subunit C-terminal domain-containing protein [Bacteroidales bacterium]
MLFSITVNSRKITAEKGETILSALNRNGINIPTLCRMKDFTPTGACRLCVVEVEGRENLVTACSEPVEEWMNIRTHSPRVIKARKTIVELLLSKHPDECLFCVNNLDCELQRLAAELNIRERRIKGRKIKPGIDQSGQSIVKELSKCVLCGRCVRVCEELVTVSTLDFINRGQKTRVGTSMNQDLNFTSCINCGQCVNVCPTGALHVKQNITEVQEYLSNHDYLKIVQYSPLVPLAVAEELGIKAPKDIDRILNGILKKIGFNKVFLTGTGTDIMIEELAEEILKRTDATDQSPLFVSACPAWVKYAEQSLHDELENLSKLKPPQQITGSLIKTILSKQLGIKPQQIYSVSVTPCTAMKFEARRDSMMTKGICDVDSVLTVRELVKLIRLYGIDVSGTEGEAADEPLNVRSALSVLAEVSGGITESIVRKIFFRLTGKDADRKMFRNIRSGGSFREAEFAPGGKKIAVAVVDGLSGLPRLYQSIASGRKYHIVEVMVCPGGCVNGAGLQVCMSKEELKNRVKQIYQTEESDILQIETFSRHLADFRGKYLDKDELLKDKKILHTYFSKRDVLL